MAAESATLKKKDEKELPAVPLAMIISLLFDKSQDQKLVKAAHEVIEKRGIFETDPSGQFTHGSYSVKGVRLDQPILVDELKEGKIEGKNVSITFQLSNIKIRNLGNFVTKKENKKLKMHFDDVMFTAHFVLKGKVENIELETTGVAGIILDEVSGEMQVEHDVKNKTGETQINEIAMNFEFKAAQFVEPRNSDLGMKHVSKLDVKRLMNTATKIYIRQNMAVLLKGVADSIKQRVNETLKDKGRKEVIAALKRDSFSK